jgi:glutamate dehydrogenase (NADP+)
MKVSSTRLTLDSFMEGLIRRNPHQTEFHQAVCEVASVLIPFINENPRYRDERILERLTEPDRVIMFRVNWEDDQGNVRVNRGYRVQQTNAIGPYKGGIRFHKTVNLSILKFLAFEQTFKNSLTGLPLGSAKGGSDFSPKDKSDREIMRFCHSFIRHLHQFIGENRDVPAGDIGVGAREIGYMHGRLMELTNRFTGTLTGKGLSYGGSLIRTEATGYGAVYFLQQMLQQAGNDIAGKKVAISGSGNVALYAAEKALDLGATVVTLSDSTGYIVDDSGIDSDKLAWVKDLKFSRFGSLELYAKEFNVPFHPQQRPWNVPVDIALPCATQNELGVADAQALINNGCIAVAEGANMPTEPKAAALLQQAGVLYAPGKASNAGGVAVSGLEMSQNSMRQTWTREQVDIRLKDIMTQIHHNCLLYGKTPSGAIDYVKGASIFGFIKVADALLAFGI